jgi:hypothetical protein
VENSFNPYAEWLGIARRSGRPNHYALLGLEPFESDTAAIVAAAERRMVQLAGIAPGEREPQRQKLSTEVQRARQTLTNAGLKKQYDELLRQKATPRSAARPSPATSAASADPLPPGATPAGPPLPTKFSSGDPMAPVIPTSAADESKAPPLLAPVEQTAPEDNRVGQISDQLASARMAARKLAVRRNKAPHWVLASTLLLIVVVGVALVVAYANGLIHLGRLPALAERTTDDPEEPFVPPPETVPDNSTIESMAPEPNAQVTTDDVPPRAADNAIAHNSKPAITNTVPKPDDPPADPAQKARFTEELAAARKALGERNSQAAKEHIDAAVKLAASGEQQELAAAIQALPKYVDGFWEAVREGLKGLEEAGELKVGNTFVSIVEVGKGRLTIRANGQNRRYPLDELPAGLAVAIANRWFDDRPDNKVYVGAFYFVDPRTDVAEAKRLWEEAASAGVDVKRLIALLPIAK